MEVIISMPASSMVIDSRKPMLPLKAHLVSSLDIVIPFRGF